MCILCKNKKTDIPTVDLNAVEQTNVNRSLGLSNVYNISNTLLFTDEVFLSPDYFVSGATKPISGITTTTNCSGPFTGGTYSVSGCSFVYNLSEIDEIDLVFNITGNTQYTGYTGSFCYHTFDLESLPRNRNYVIKSDSVLSDCFVYNTITGNTIYETINKGELPVKDAQYILRDYNIFTTKEFSQNLQINTFDLSTQPIDSLFDDGWYFVTVTNPEPATIGQSDGFDITRNTKLVSGPAELVEGQTTIFRINGNALNNTFVVYVNGIQLTKGQDWVNVNPYSGMFEIVSGTIEPGKDIVQVTYISPEERLPNIIDNNETGIYLDAGIVSTIVTGVTSGVTALTVNYNPVKNRQEILLTKPMRDRSAVIFTVNGVNLTEDLEYFKSSSDSSKIIMSPTNPILVGDAISIFYFTNESADYFDLGYFRTLTPTITWGVPFSYSGYRSEDGVFLLQVTTKNDPNFLNPIQAKYYDFNTTQTTYSAVLDQLPTNLGQNFLVRVYFFKNYNILFNNIITTRSVSNTAAFRVNVDYAENTY